MRVNFLNFVENWWRRCSLSTTSLLVTQLSWIARRGPDVGLWPCHELSARRKISNVPP